MHNGFSTLACALPDNYLMRIYAWTCKDKWYKDIQAMYANETKHKTKLKRSTYLSILYEFLSNDNNNDGQ